MWTNFSFPCMTIVGKLKIEILEKKSPKVPLWRKITNIRFALTNFFCSTYTKVFRAHTKKYLKHSQKSIFQHIQKKYLQHIQKSICSTHKKVFAAHTKTYLQQSQKVFAALTQKYYTPSQSFGT